MEYIVSNEEIIKPQMILIAGQQVRVKEEVGLTLNPL
jgi:hypothetical protein